jgi:two-component system KDP operon response regulator KdpE
MDGIEVTRRLREWTQVPIIIVTVQEQEAAKVAALDAGADDYVTKPFSMGELLARMRAALRRATAPAGEPVFSSEELIVDLARARCREDGRHAEVSMREAGRHPVVSRELERRAGQYRCSEGGCAGR